MANRAVIFDFGGVLYKTKDYSYRHMWDDELNLEAGSVERIVHNNTTWKATQSGNLPLEAYYQDVANQLELPVNTVANSLMPDFYRGDRLDPHLMTFIRTLKSEEITVGLLSNDHADLLRPRLSRLGITMLFDQILISSEIGYMKPHTNTYQAVLNWLNRPADEIIFIDDSPANIKSAVAFGLHGIFYTDGIDVAAIVRELLPL